MSDGTAYEPNRGATNQYPHSFAFALVKAASAGALAGLGLLFVNEAVKKRGSVMNKYIKQLPIQGLEGLGEEHKLCEYFHELNARGFRNANPQAYDAALFKTSELYFMAEQIADGLLDRQIERIENGEIDPFNLTYYVEASDLWYDIHDELQTLYNAVRDAEFERIDKRDRDEAKYLEDVAVWQSQCVLWEERRLHAQKEKMRRDMQSSTNLGEMSSSAPPPAAQASEPEPRKPVEPASIKVKYRSDFVDDYATAIDERNLSTLFYIRDTLSKFRKDHPGPLRRRSATSGGSSTSFLYDGADEN